MDIEEEGRALVRSSQRVLAHAKEIVMVRRRVSTWGYGDNSSGSPCMCGEAFKSLGQLRLHIIERRFAEEPHGFVNSDQEEHYDWRMQRRLKRSKGEME